MSLQVWLPLDGNLRNQGLNGTVVTNHGATVDSNGKIGQCYQNTASNYCTIPVTINSTLPFSMCFWYRIDTWVGWGTALTLNDANGNHIGICSHSNGTSVGTNWYEGSTSISDRYHSLTFVAGTWYHFAIISDGNSIKTFINGTQSNVITTYSNSPTKTFTQLTLFKRGTKNVYGRNSLNDVRIYDHALSVKEVKEIAKGLVLHYPLNKPQANMAKGGNTYDLSLNSWVFSNQNGGTVRTLEYDEYGTPCVRLTRDDTAASGWSYFHYDRIENTKIKTNTTYTISFDIKASVSGTVGMSGFMYGNATNQLSNSNSNIQNSIIANKWNHIILQTTTKSDFSGLATTGQIIYMSLSSNFRNTGATMLLKNIKLEEGNKETPWIPNESDPLYAAAGYASGIVYDCSGYQNNGIEVGTITGSSDTPRYRSSYYFDGINSAIQVPYNATVFQTNFTINLWFKKTELGSKGYETLFGGPSGFEMDTRNGNSTTLSLYMTGTRGGNAFSSFSFGEWYMVTMVNDGTNELYYINGELKKTIEKKSMPTGNYFIGAWSTSSKQNFKGYISDFRIYCTALSAADVKALYTDAGYVDKNGNFHAYEFVEG